MVLVAELHLQKHTWCNLKVLLNIDSELLTATECSRKVMRCRSTDNAYVILNREVQRQTNISLLKNVLEFDFW